MIYASWLMTELLLERKLTKILLLLFEILMTTFLRLKNNLKLVSTIFYKNVWFSPNDGPSKNMKDVCYFM